MATKTLHFPNPRHLNQLYAGRDENLAYAERAFEVKLTSREDWLKIDGSLGAITAVETLFGHLNDARNQGVVIRTPDYHRFVDMLARGEVEALRALFAEPLVISTQRRTIVPKTLGQKLYLQSMQR